jgi:hypothetical protein
LSAIGRLLPHGRFVEGTARLLDHTDALCECGDLRRNPFVREMISAGLRDVASPDDQAGRLHRGRESLPDDRVIEAIARRVSDLLRQGSPSVLEERLVSAAEIARRFAVSRAWVYENADRPAPCASDAACALG